MNDNLEKFINYATENGQNENIELEARFGKYSKLTSNIKPNTFFKVYELFKSRSKSFSFINDILYDDVRKRNTLTDEKSYAKYLFDNPDKILATIEGYTKTYSTKKGENPIYLSKDKIFKPIQSTNIKIDLVLEKPENNKPITNPSYQKNKFRCSLKGLWDIDMTILLITDCKTKNSGVYFEIEMEFNYKWFINKKSTIEDVLAEFKQNSDAIITTIECARNTALDVELRYSIFNQVITLERKDLSKLTHCKYSVTEKADGERVFIYIDNKKNVYKINPTNIILDKIPLAKLQKSLKISNTLIDGELIDDKLFLGFDLLYFAEKDYRNFNLKMRLKYLQEAISELNKLKININFKVKTFYFPKNGTNIFTHAQNAWNNRAKLFPYNLDGLIFTPVKGAYQGNLPNLKWKDKHSIDVRIMYNAQYNFTEFHPHTIPYTRKGTSEIANAYTDHGTGNIYYKRRLNTNNEKNNSKYKQMNLVSVRGDLGISGKLKGAEHLKNMVDIVEIEYDPQLSQWIYLRTRPDKQKPNAYKSIISVLDAITDNITIGEISKLKYKQSPYELLEVADCYTDIGFNFISPDISDICQFYINVYDNILSKQTGETILVLGCDLCILRVVAKHYKNILIIEPNCLEVYGEQQSEGYMGLLEQAKIAGINATIVWGHSEISNGLKAFTKSGQNEIDAFMKKHKTASVVFINVFSHMILPSSSNFLYSSSKIPDIKINKDMFDKTIKNLKSMSKTIVGLFLNGTQVIKYLERQDCLLMKNKELHPLFRLYLSATKNNYITTDIFKEKNITMMEIQRMQNSFMTQYQPLVFNKNINDTFKDAGLKIKECKSLKSFYPDYKKKYGALSEYDIIIADITNYFII